MGTPLTPPIQSASAAFSVKGEHSAQTPLRQVQARESRAVTLEVRAFRAKTLARVSTSEWLWSLGLVFQVGQAGFVSACRFPCCFGRIFNYLIGPHSTPKLTPLGRDRVVPVVQWHRFALWSPQETRPFPG